MKLLPLLSASLLVSVLNAPVFAGVDTKVSETKESEVASATEVSEEKEAQAEDTAKTEKEEGAAAEVVTDFNAGLADLVGNIIEDEQLSPEEEALEKEELASHDEIVPQKEGEAEVEEAAE